MKTTNITGAEKAFRIISEGNIKAKRLAETASCYLETKLDSGERLTYKSTVAAIKQADSMLGIKASSDELALAYFLLEIFWVYGKEISSTVMFAPGKDKPDDYCATMRNIYYRIITRQICA